MTVAQKNDVIHNVINPVEKSTDIVGRFCFSRTHPCGTFKCAENLSGDDYDAQSDTGRSDW